MTKLLEKVVREASKLPDTEQDAVAAILLEEMASEERWSAAFSKSQGLLAELADKALAEHAAGQTKPL